MRKYFLRIEIRPYTNEGSENYDMIKIFNSPLFIQRWNV